MISRLSLLYENAAAISEAAKAEDKTVEAYVAVDTGMGRIGFLPDDESIQEFKKINGLSNLKIKGLFSHFATADEEDKAYAEQQLAHYNTVYEKLKQAGVDIPPQNLCKQRRHHGNTCSIL